MRVVGVAPAAGYAKRLQPLGVSKEMYPIGGHVVMDYLLDRMALAGSEVFVVTRAAKVDVRRHAHGRGARVVVGAPPTLGASIAMALEGLRDDDIALIGFPDSIWHPEDAFNLLLPKLAVSDTVLGLFTTDHPETCDVVLTNVQGRVLALELKSPHPSSNVFWGIAAARVRALAGVAQDGDPGKLFARGCRRTRIESVWISDDYLDVGTPANLRRAVAKYGDRS